LTNHNIIKQQAGASGAGPKSQGGWMILPVILHHKGFCNVQKRLLSGTTFFFFLLFSFLVIFVLWFVLCPSSVQGFPVCLLLLILLSDLL
jgi:hypothetical protein